MPGPRISDTDFYTRWWIFRNVYNRLWLQRGNFDIDHHRNSVIQRSYKKHRHFSSHFSGLVTSYNHHWGKPLFIPDAGQGLLMCEERGRVRKGEWTKNVRNTRATLSITLTLFPPHCKLLRSVIGTLVLIRFLLPFIQADIPIKKNESSIFIPKSKYTKTMRYCTRWATFGITWIYKRRDQRIRQRKCITRGEKKKMAPIINLLPRAFTQDWISHTGLILD